MKKNKDEKLEALLGRLILKICLIAYTDDLYHIDYEVSKVLDEEQKWKK
jgi:hypothetical protein